MIKPRIQRQRDGF